MSQIKDPVGLILSWEESGVDINEEPELAKAIAAAILATGLHHSAGHYGRFVRDVFEALAEEDETDGEQTLVVSKEYLV